MSTEAVICLRQFTWIFLRYCCIPVKVISLYVHSYIDEHDESNDRSPTQSVLIAFSSMVCFGAATKRNWSFSTLSTISI